jgi:hypothetical protein
LGFIVFPWYAPILGLVVIPLILSFIYRFTYRSNFIFGIGNQVSIFFGFIICVLVFIDFYFYPIFY